MNSGKVPRSRYSSTEIPGGASSAAARKSMLFNEPDRKLPDIANIFTGFITCRLRFAMCLSLSRLKTRHLRIYSTRCASRSCHRPGLKTSGQTDWWLLLFLPDGLSRTSTCLQQLKSPRNCYALRKLQKTQEPHRRRASRPAPGLVSKVDRHDPIGRLKRMTLGKFFVAGLVALFGGTIKPAHAQFPYPIPPPPPPIFNPSTPYTMPPMRQTPVAPGLPSTLPNSSFCSTFDLGPCFPQSARPRERGVSQSNAHADTDGP